MTAELILNTMLALGVASFIYIIACIIYIAFRNAFRK